MASGRDLEKDENKHPSENVCQNRVYQKNQKSKKKYAYFWSKLP